MTTENADINWDPSLFGSELQRLKTHWDIKYRINGGSIGELVAFLAYDKETAEHTAPHALVASSHISPTKVEILDVVKTPEHRLPKI